MFPTSSSAEKLYLRARILSVVNVRKTCGKSFREEIVVPDQKQNILSLSLEIRHCVTEYSLVYYPTACRQPRLLGEMLI